MWLLIFNLWHIKEKKRGGDIKQYTHLQKGLKAKQMIIIIKIMIAIVIIIIKQKVNSF